MKQHAVMAVVIASLLLGNGSSAQAYEVRWETTAALSTPVFPELTLTSNTPPVAATPAPSFATQYPTTGLGDMSGTFDVQGTEAVGKEAYRGVATVTKLGEVYLVNYKDDESTVEGVGLVEGLIFSISYISEGVPAILMLKKTSDGDMEGPWAYRGENFVSREVWKRR